MTEQEITALGPAFAGYLRRFRDSVGQDRTPTKGPVSGLLKRLGKTI